MFAAPRNGCRHSSPHSPFSNEKEFRPLRRATKGSAFGNRSLERLANFPLPPLRGDKISFAYIAKLLFISSVDNCYKNLTL